MSAVIELPLWCSATAGWSTNGSSYGTAGGSWIGPVAEMPTSGTSQVANELVDINGDGLDDWMNAGSGSITFCLNTGSAWASCNSPWNIATSSRGINGWDRGIRFIDINGDGLPDYVRSYSYNNKYSGTLDIEKGTHNYVYLDTGSGWATSTLQVPATIVSADNIPAGSWGGRIVYNELVDWNGDGILDTDTQTSTTARPDLLNRITLPTGGTKEVGYRFLVAAGEPEPEPRVPDAPCREHDEQRWGRARRRSIPMKAGRCTSRETHVTDASRGLRKSRSKTASASRRRITTKAIPHPRPGAS